MSFVILILLAAMGTGLLLGGSLRRFERVRLHWWGAALLGLAAQGITLPSAGWFAGGVAAASYACLLGFVAVNRRLPAALLMGAGLALNLAVTLPNGGMPVSRGALESSGQADVLQMLIDEGAAKHHLLTDGDVLTPLADVIPVGGPIQQVVSLGDVFVYAGLMWLIVAVMRGRIPQETLRGQGAYRGKHRKGGEPPADLEPPSIPPAATMSGTAP